MKKTIPALAFLLFATTVNAMSSGTQGSTQSSTKSSAPKPANTGPFLKIELKNPKQFTPITITYDAGPITISYDEVEKMVKDLLDNLKEQGKEIPENEIPGLYDTLSEYLAADAAKIFSALLRRIDQKPEVMAAIKKAIEKIFKEYIMQEMITESKDSLTEKDYLDAKNEIVAEKGEQVLLNVVLLPEKNNGSRIIRKMKSVDLDKKSTEWFKLISDYKNKTLEAILISDLPKALRDMLEKAETGDVLTMEIPNQENPKSPQSALFFVMKKERINGDLLMKGVNSKIMSVIQKTITEKMMQLVNVVKFDPAGKIIDTSKTKGASESAAPASAAPAA